jgi:hypothetical protein
VAFDDHEDVINRKSILDRRRYHKHAGLVLREDLAIEFLTLPDVITDDYIIVFVDKVKGKNVTAI